MKILYGIEPDLCIVNPQLVTDHSQDVVLPKYFYLQLVHLKNGDFESATEGAKKIIDSLRPSSAEDLLIFQTLAGGTVYFHDQEINLDNFHAYGNLDFNNPLDRYFLNLAKISEILAAQVVFITSSTEIFQKCRVLHFERATVEEFLGTREAFSPVGGESWLQPEMILDIQARFDPMAQIQWQEEETEEAGSQENDISWIEITPSNLDLERESDRPF
ncbi:MAG: hypothetical protein Fur0025_46580 [Oscillatoriaceae cyanobacterium]